MRLLAHYGAHRIIRHITTTTNDDGNVVFTYQFDEGTLVQHGVDRWVTPQAGEQPIASLSVTMAMAPQVKVEGDTSSSSAEAATTATSS